MSKRVGLVIVTYNRIDLLKELLLSLENQTHEIDNFFIFDNFSSDGTEEYFENIMSSDIECNRIYQKGKIIYYRNSYNCGGAGGFECALKMTYDMDKFDYIWTMDDDVIPEHDCLEKLLKYQDSQCLITVPNRTDKNYKDKAIIKMNLDNPFKLFTRRKVCVSIEQNDRTEFYNVVDMPFEGPLFNVKIMKKIGFPNSKYFIQFDDTDYATRAVQFTTIRFITGAILHKQIIPRASKNKCLDWKGYYAYRNDAVYCKKYGKNFLVRNLTPFLVLITMILKAIVKRKWKNIGIMLRAYKDAISNNMGMTVNPGEF